MNRFNRELGWNPCDSRDDVRGGRPRRRDDLDVFYPNSEEHVYYPRKEYGNTSYINYNEYTSARPYMYNQPSYYEQQYANSYQNRDVNTNFYHNARYNNRRDYSQRPNRGNRKRIPRNNYPRTYQTTMTSDKNEPTVNPIESTTVSTCASEDQQNVMDQCIDLTDLSDAETVHLEHEDDDLRGLPNTSCGKIHTESFAITDSQGTSINIEVQTDKSFIVNNDNQKKDTEEHSSIPLSMPLLTTEGVDNTLNPSKHKDNEPNTGYKENLASSSGKKENDKNMSESNASEHFNNKSNNQKLDRNNLRSYRKEKQPAPNTKEKNKKVDSVCGNKRLSTDKSKEYSHNEYNKKICKSSKDKSKSDRDSTNRKLGSGSKQTTKPHKELKDNKSKGLVTEIRNEHKSDALFSNEDINKLNKKLANLEHSDDRSHENLLHDMEVEQIMCNSSSQPENIASTHRMITRSRARGKSCIPFERRESEPKLVRSKSLQAKDFLCYTPFRVTRSISRNFLLSPGIVDENIQKIFDGGSDTKTKSSNIRKRRQTIDISEIPKKKPSLFSEQTPYVKPQAIEFSYTPRSSDVYYLDDSHESQNTVNVTVIYNGTDLDDPRKRCNATNARYSNKDTKPNNSTRRLSSSPQQNHTVSKDAPKKIGGRRKSSTTKCDDDPDYVPTIKIAVTPRSSLTGNNDPDYAPSNELILAPRDTASLVRRNSETILNDANSTRKHVETKQIPARKKNQIHLENEKKMDNMVESVSTIKSTKVEKVPGSYKPSSNCVQQTAMRATGRSSTNTKLEKVPECHRPGSNCVQQSGMPLTRRNSTNAKVEKVPESYNSGSNSVQQPGMIPTKKKSTNTKEKALDNCKPGPNCVQQSGTKPTRRDSTSKKAEKVTESNKLDSNSVQQATMKPTRRNSTITNIRHYNDVVQSISFIEGISSTIHPEKRIKRKAISVIQEDLLVNKDAITVQNTVEVSTPECKTNQISKSLSIRRNRSKSLEVPILQPITSTSPADLSTIFDELGNFFCMIKTLNANLRYGIRELNMITIPDSLRGCELIALSDFYNIRIRHWTIKFRELCETLKPQMCNPRIFVDCLMVKVIAKDASTTYSVFLSILIVIIKSLMPSEIPISFVETLKPHVTNLIMQEAAHREKIANKSSASGALAIENLKTSTSTSSVPQVTHNTRSSIIVPPVSSHTTFLTEAQVKTLKNQMVAYHNILQNYKRLTSSIQPLANVTLTTTQHKTRAAAKKRSQVLLPANASGRPQQIKPSPNVTVPSILTVSQINQRLDHRSIHNFPTENSDTSRKTVIRTSAKTVPPPLTILGSDKPMPTLPLQTSRIMKAVSIPEKTIDPPQNVGLNLKLQPTITTTVTSQVLVDVNCNIPGTDLREEFVDLERYFNVNSTNHMETLVRSSQVLSNDNKNLEISMQGISVPCKEPEESSEYRKVSEVTQDLPPRTASNDSGMDSPTQVDSSIYENRICLCGRSAVYVCPCKAIMYCSDACQRIDWDIHKDSFEHRTLLQAVQRI